MTTWDDTFNSPQVREYAKRQHAHDLICYSEKKSCFSCGCNANLYSACYAHQGTPRHMAHLKEQEIALLQRIAEAQERNNK